MNVDKAILQVRAGSSGEAGFATAEEAQDFVLRVMAIYPSEGYGTWADINGTTVKWRVYSAD